MSVESDISEIKVSIERINSNLNNLGRNFDRSLRDLDEMEHRVRNCEECVTLIRGSPSQPGLAGLVKEIAEDVRRLKKADSERRGAGRIIEVLLAAATSFLVALGVVKLS